MKTRRPLLRKTHPASAVLRETLESLPSSRERAWREMFSSHTRSLKEACRRLKTRAAALRRRRASRAPLRIFTCVSAAGRRCWSGKCPSIRIITSLWTCRNRSVPQSPATVRFRLLSRPAGRAERGLRAARRPREPECRETPAHWTPSLKGHDVQQQSGQAFEMIFKPFR